MSRAPLAPPPSTRLALAALLAAVPSTPAGAACPANHDFTVIADTADEWSAFDHEPAITSGGRVAFVGQLDAGGAGLFAGTGLSPAVPRMFDRVADPTSNFVEFGAPAVNGESQIAFWARLFRTVEPSDPEGIFRADDGLQPPTVIALDRNADPSSIYLGVAQDPDIRLNGRVVYSASLLGGATHVLHEGPGEFELASSASDPYHSHQHPMVSASPTYFTYYALNDAAPEGTVLRGDLPVGESDPVAGSFLGVNPVISDGGGVAYLELYPAAPPPAPLETRVRRWSDGIPPPGGAIVVDSGVDPVHNLHLATLSAAGGRCVLFDAFHEVPLEGPKLFLGDPDEFHPIFERGVPILDGFVSDFAIGRHAANNRGQVAIWVRINLGGGNSRELIVRADPPGTGASYYDDGFETGDFGRWSDFVDD